MVFYSAFVMDALTRRILLFCRDHKRIWQTAHTSYRPPPSTMDENEQGTVEAFAPCFELADDPKHPVRTVQGPLVSLSIVHPKLVRTDYEYGDILPWDIDEALRLHLDPRTRQAIRANIGLLMFFADTDRDVWCPMQEFGYAART